MKKTTRTLILIIQLTIFLSSCLSINQSEVDNENISGTIEPLSTETPKSPNIETAQSTITPTVKSELTHGELPVIVSYIEEIDGQIKIISTALNFQSNYVSISVDKDTDFRGQIAVDSDLNLYILYGFRTNYFSKLSIDGNIETIEIPYEWEIQTLWVGNKIFILANEPSMAVINTDLTITTISPAINILEDDKASIGYLGMTNTPSPTVIWISSHPIENIMGDYALYRTLSLDTLTINDNKLRIPNSNWNWYESDSPTQHIGERLETIVYGVDIQNKNVLLCYNYIKEGNNQSISSKLELFASKTGEPIISYDFPCMNRIYDLRGNSIISMTNPLSGGVVQVLGLNDLQPLFDFTEFFDMKNYYDNWISSNGVYWQIVSKNRITVLNSDPKDEISYSMPSNLPTDIIPGTTLLSAFLIEE